MRTSCAINSLTSRTGFIIDFSRNCSDRCHPDGWIPVAGFKEVLLLIISSQLLVLLIKREGSTIVTYFEDLSTSSFRSFSSFSRIYDIWIKECHLLLRFFETYSEHTPFLK